MMYFSSFGLCFIFYRKIRKYGLGSIAMQVMWLMRKSRSIRRSLLNVKERGNIAITRIIIIIIKDTKLNIKR
jgi:hypothetical protein